jgi:hypothetical protein
MMSKGPELLGAFFKGRICPASLVPERVKVRTGCGMFLKWRSPSDSKPIESLLRI